MFQCLWLPLMATVAAIALSAILFKELLKKKKRAGQNAVEGGADSDSAPRNGNAESSARTCTSPAVNETATSSGHDWEVFLSFRGPDTRSGFTDFIYTSLTDAGIRTFKDDKELRVGEKFAPELLQAINQSKISIPIFSKGYASSVWCLKELVQMVECQKTRGQKIMPIFYDVAPSEVQHQTGSYRRAFRSHKNKKRHDEKAMQEWKAALEEVSSLKGWDLHRMPNRREGEFARKLTQEVFKELKKAHLWESDYLVSVDNQVDAIMEMICAGTNETRIMGIHGMGGIGKTTTAKIIYNKLADDFENHCFLRDIRERSKVNGMQCLQNQLISDILKGTCMDIKDINEGTQTIKERLSNKRVLLLLDDVGEKNHIDALICKRDWLGRGSKIIITTRRIDILCVPEVDCRYGLSGMDSNQSLQLFSKHAFRRNFPLDEYIDQSNRAIDIAGGLPLALEVIGSLLSLTKKEEWDLKLNKLEDAPDEKVWRKLKISYDVLDVGQQHIFLDIACFFIGYDKNIVVHFWESKFFPEDTMEVLQNMSLIKIKENNKVWMHDQIRDLGREMVRQKSKMKVKKQSRVWDPKEVLELLKRREGKTKVEALCLDGRYRLTYEDFKRLSNLRLLQVGGHGWRRIYANITVEERLHWNEGASNGLPTNVFLENSNLLPQLRWLSWSGIPPTFNVTNFSMENVVILDLSKSGITDDWKGWSHMKVMKNLKVLDLSFCNCLKRTPNFSAHANLECLILRGCGLFIELDRSICQLKRLTYLDVGFCEKLRKLPDELGDLASLEYLSLFRCKNLKRLPETIGNLESLIMLSISDTEIKELPDSIEKLKNLEVMQIQYSCISKIPDALWTIEKLEEIRASKYFWGGRFHVKIGNCIRRNQSLRILSLTEANIFELPRLPESLLELRLSKLDMGTFPDLSNLINLKELDLGFEPRDCAKPRGLEEVPIPRWVGGLSKLERLGLSCPFVTTSPTDLSLPPQLKSLRLDCPNLRRLPTLPSSLSSLSLCFCESLRSMEDVLHLKKLSSLEIVGAAIIEIPDLGCLENLGDLDLRSLEQVEIPPDLSNLNRLRSLDVSFCDNLVEIRGELPESLQELHIFSCKSLQKLPYLSSSMGLQKVHIGKCGNLVEIQGELPRSLVQLEINSCKSLQKLPHLSSSMGLREVYICKCGNLVEIQGELPQSLVRLDIDSCKSLQKLPYLSSSMGLRAVSIRKCGNLVEIQGELPQSLEELNVSFCKSLQELPNLSSSMGLQAVSIRKCGNLVEIQGELPQSLERLKIDSCKSLQKLPHLSSSMGLQEVYICKCGNLVEIQGELPQSLEELNISFCKSLQELPNLSSLKRLQKVEINRCRNLNVEAISSLCLEKSVKFVGEDVKWDREDNKSESEGEDAESESE